MCTTGMYEYAIGGTRDWTYDETYCNNAAVNTARGNEPCSTNDCSNWRLA